MTDESMMPFGVHEGKKMKAVPGGYLLWCADQDWIGEWPELREYIEKNRDTLEKEAAGE